MHLTLTLTLALTVALAITPFLTITVFLTLILTLTLIPTLTLILTDPNPDSNPDPDPDPDPGPHPNPKIRSERENNAQSQPAITDLAPRVKLEFLTLIITLTLAGNTGYRYLPALEATGIATIAELVECNLSETVPYQGGMKGQC